MSRFKMKFYGPSGCLLSRDEWPSSCTVGRACQCLTDCSWTDIPLAHLGFIPRHQTLKIENVLAPDALLRPYASTGMHVVDTRTLPPSVADATFLSSRLPHIHESARLQLLERLHQFTPEQVDLASIREQPSGLSTAAASVQELYRQILLTSTSTALPQASIHVEGEELFPVRLLPDNGGVEFRSGYTHEYRAVIEKDRLAQAELSAAIAHCKKLLADLPIALANSEAAQLAHSKADEVDLNTLGAMCVEQIRIKQEIASQGAKLNQLEEDAAAIQKNLPNSMKLFKHQTQLTLPFGQTKVGDHIYQLRAVAPFHASSTGQAVPMTIDFE